ncbi:MAG: LuxR C-terminal-related transcriptional regulator [Actinomycetota bacterium]
MPGSPLTGRDAPVPVAPMVGRAELVDEVGRLVRAHRLVVLMGAGGVGKTRLAVAVARTLADDFADGVWMIELASLTDPTAVPEAMATTLGVVAQDNVSVIDAVAEAVAGRRLLLVVDNCEHVAPAVTSAIGTILGRSDTPKVLATSRESLWIAGEQRVAVAPLATDGPDSDAVRLFVERARDARRGFALDDPETADAVVEICRTLDGLPLAIELAAARIASVTALELRGVLAHRFRLLTGPEHRPDRQRTLEQVVAWSYDLLTEDERRVLRSASVFLGGFGLDGLADVMGETDPIAVLVPLDSLVNKSLVVAEPVGASTRYRLLETIRLFGEVRLTKLGEIAELRDRHAVHYAQAAAARWEQWNGPGWRDTCDWLLAELANLRGAFRWSARRDDVETATDIAAHAALIGVSVQVLETVAWAEELLEAATLADGPRLPRLYTGAGYACFAGRPRQAAEHAHRATELEREPGRDPCEPGLATFVEALARVYSGDLDTYVVLAARVASLPGAARAYGLPAYVDGLQASGRVDEAIALTEESVATARDLGNPFWITYALWTAGLAHASTDPARALTAWDEGVEFLREHRVDFFEGFIARDAARLRAAHGEVETSLPLFVTAIHSFRQSGNVAQLTITVASVPEVLEQLGALLPAATLHAAITREPASIQHVRTLTDLAVRLAEQLGAPEQVECRARGAALDLNDAATYACEQLDAARAELVRRQRHEPPGGLTRRELDVLRLVADGQTTSEIARRLFISAKTADDHIQHIYTKVGVSNRVAVARWAVEQGLVVGAAR